MMNRHKFKVGKLYLLKKDSEYVRHECTIIMYLHDDEIIRKGFIFGHSNGRSCNIMLKDHPVLVLATNYDSAGDIGFCKILTGERIGWVNLDHPGLKSFTELKAENEV